MKRSVNWSRSVAVSLVVAAVVALTGAPYALAQEKPQLQIRLESLVEQELKCGLNEASIVSIAALTLRNSGIPTVPRASSFPYFLYISVTGLFQDRTGLCIINLHVSVRKQGELGTGLFRHRTGVTGVLVVAEAGTLITRNQSEANAYFLTRLEQIIKEVLGKLEY